MRAATMKTGSIVEWRPLGAQNAQQSGWSAFDPSSGAV